MPVSQDLLLLFGGIINLCVYMGEHVVVLNIITRSKLFIGCIKAVANAAFAVVIYWAFSYSLAVGSGENGLLIGSNQYFAFGQKDGGLTWFYILSLLIVSLSPMMNLKNNFSAGVPLFVSVIFPAIYHWAFSVDGWASALRSSRQKLLFQGCGVLDVGGSSALFLAPGISYYFINVFFLNFSFPRKMADLFVSDIYQMNPTYSAMRPFLVLIGVLALNSINNLLVNSTGADIQKRIINSLISCSVSYLMAFSYVLMSAKNEEMIRLPTNALITGLIAANACCAVIDTPLAVAVGTVACALHLVVHRALLPLGDGAFASVYITGAVWGLLASGLFATREGYSRHLPDVYSDGTNRASNCAGLLYRGSGNQLLANALFIVAVIAWSAFATLVLHVLVTLSSLCWSRKKRGSAGNHNTATVYASKEKVESEFAQQSLDDEPVTNLNELALDDDFENAFFDMFYCSECRESFRNNAIATISGPQKGTYITAEEVFDDRRLSVFSFEKPLDKGEYHVEISETEPLADPGDVFESRYGYGYDIVFVLNMPAKGQSMFEKGEGSDGKIQSRGDGSTKKNQIATQESLERIRSASLDIIEKLHSVGLETQQYRSSVGGDDAVIVKVRARVPVLRKYAAQAGHRFLLKEEALRAAGKAGYTANTATESIIIEPFEIAHRPTESSIGPYRHIFAKYTLEAHAEPLFENADGLNHPFGQVDRLKLLFALIERRDAYSCGLDVKDLMEKKIVLGYFPLHDVKGVERLAASWLAWSQPPWTQPNDMLRQYFGETLSMYFQFLAHYSTWLALLSVLGLIPTVHIIIESNIFGSLAAALKYSYTIPIFSFLTCVWSIGMLKSYESVEMKAAMRWGTDGFEAEEKERFEFTGERIISHIDGSEQLYFATAEHRRRFRMSNFKTALMLIFDIMGQTGIFALKWYLTDTTNGPTYANICSSVFITLMSKAYASVSVKLTNYENWRTDTEYADALIVKLFAFNFVNKFLPYWYVAFVKPSIGLSCQGGCASELFTSLLTIFISTVVTDNISTYVMPRVSTFVKRFMSKRKGGRRKTSAYEINDQRSQAENEFVLEQYADFVGIMGDYNQIALQFGLLALFAPSLTFSPILCYLANHVELRSDGWKLLQSFQRPWPTSAEDIGSWNVIFKLVALSGVLCNAAIIFYTMDIFDEFAPMVRLWFACCFVGAAMLARSCVGTVLGGSPVEVEIQKKRENHVISKVIDRMPDRIESLTASSSDLALPNYTASSNQTDHVTPMSPLGGWNNDHLRDRYLGLLNEFSWTGYLITWSMEIVLEKGMVSPMQVLPMQVIGYMRWRMSSAVPYKKDHDESRLAGYMEKITNRWEADEMFAGSFDTSNGALRLTTHSLRTLPGNACTDASQFIGMCHYSFVLTHDGSEMVGRCTYAHETSLPIENFFNSSTIRCVANSIA